MNSWDEDSSVLSEGSTATRVVALLCVGDETGTVSVLNITDALYHRMQQLGVEARNVPEDHSKKYNPRIQGSMTLSTAMASGSSSSAILKERLTRLRNMLRGREQDGSNELRHLNEESSTPRSQSSTPRNKLQRRPSIVGTLRSRTMSVESMVAADALPNWRFLRSHWRGHVEAVSITKAP